MMNMKLLLRKLPIFVFLGLFVIYEHSSFKANDIYIVAVKNSELQLILFLNIISNNEFHFILYRFIYK